MGKRRGPNPIDDGTDDSGSDVAVAEPRIRHEEVFEDVSDPADGPPAEDQYATFEIINGGLEQRITTANPDFVPVGVPNAGAPVMREVGRSKIAKFKEGRYRTCDPEEIEVLMKPVSGFGTLYGMDMEDPTGYWRRIGRIKVRTRTVIDHEVVEDAPKPSRGVQVHTGAKTMAHAREARLA